MSDEREIEFVAKHYRKGSFDVEKAWSVLAIASPRKWRSLRVAAAVAAITVLSATAAIIYRHYEPSPAQTTVDTAAEVSSPAEVIRLIDFDETSLTVVVEKIKEVYGVNIVNLPEDAASYTLSLRYEGSAEDLIATINELLGTEMTIEK